MSVDAVVVRPDSKITLPLINEVSVIGLTPAQLTLRIAQASRASRGPERERDRPADQQPEGLHTGQVQKPGHAS
jgi:protein involved in polysaccharide export with SLBB domain